MSCCGRAVGTPPCSVGIRESLAWVTAGRTCQGKPSGGGPGVSIKLISREVRTSAVSNNFNMNLRDSSFQNSTCLKMAWEKETEMLRKSWTFKANYVRSTAQTLNRDVKLACVHIYQTHLRCMFVKLYLRTGSNLADCTQRFLMCTLGLKMLLSEFNSVDLYWSLGEICLK